MSEHDPDRPAPESPGEEQPPEADFLFPDTDKGILHPEQDDDSDSDSDSDD